MDASRLGTLCAAAVSGELLYTDHSRMRLRHRPTPSAYAIRLLLCDDAPEIIEDYPNDPRGSSCLVWGIIGDGRVAHVVCRNLPDSRVITAYFPSETEPENWRDNYRERRQVG